MLPKRFPRPSPGKQHQQKPLRHRGIANRPAFKGIRTEEPPDQCSAMTPLQGRIYVLATACPFASACRTGLR
jgi:hypothetical protein